MKIVALYSIKGGVGKTSSAVNLAFISACKGYRTLVWDLDPQGASSYYFRIKPKVKGGSKDLIAGKRELDGLIKGTDFENLDLLPADFSFRNLDLVLDARKKPTQQLKKLLKPLAAEYDYIFLDCPPNISLLSEAVFEAADILLSPIIPTTLSLRTLEQLKEFIEDNKLHTSDAYTLFFDGRPAQKNAPGHYGKSGEESSGDVNYRYSLCQRYRTHGPGTYAIRRLYP